MKATHQMIAEWIEENPSKLERTEIDDTTTLDQRDEILREVLSGLTGRKAHAFAGASKKDACTYATNVLSALADTLEDRQQLETLGIAIDAFSEWSQDRTRGPEAVLSYCTWMKKKIQEHWYDKSVIWAGVSLNLMLCDNAIRGFHRLEDQEVEQGYLLLILNAAEFNSRARHNLPQFPGSADTSAFDRFPLESN
ncbi:hypothetical protein N9891_00030 [bacterium]|nr:hypothetical protein [bacterium]